MVHQIVAGFLRRLPPNVLRDDLVAAGTYGLVDSLRKSPQHDDPSFEHYVRIRVRGAILDELRAQDWLPRRTRAAATAQQSNGTCCVPSSVVGFDDLPSGDRAAKLVDVQATDPAQSVESTLEHKELARAVQSLPERERTIISLHYFRGVKFKDIGSQLGVSEPRISQLHARAVGRLRAFLTDEREAA